MFSFLYPSSCFVCGNFGAYICLHCQKKLRPLFPQRCIYCENASYLGLTHEKCRRKNGLDGVFSILIYTNEVKKIIANIKYRLITDAWNDVLFSLKPEWLYDVGKLIKLSKQPITYQPIPLSSKRQKERGFNQAEKIAQFFQLFYQYPITSHLHRIKNTQSQAQIQNPNLRHLNMKNAFILRLYNKLYIPKTTILVDDVITTGSTTMSAALEIKKRGMERVYALSLARG